MNATPPPTSTATPTPPLRLDPRASAVVLIDLQERVIPLMHERRTLVRRASRLIDGANVLGVPVWVTQQHPRSLGDTANVVTPQRKGAVFSDEAYRFSALGPALRDAIAARGVRSVVLAGVEAHVSVLHTALDLLDAGLTVAVCQDAVSARRPADLRAALRRMEQAGVLPASVEGALLEMLGTPEDPRFKPLHAVIRSDG